MKLWLKYFIILDSHRYHKIIKEKNLEEIDLTII